MDDKTILEDNKLHHSFVGTLPAGTVLHGSAYDYTIERVLGQGSFGITYLATFKTSVQGPLGMMEATVRAAIKEFFMREVNGREGTTVTSGSKGGVYDKYRKKFIGEAQNLSKLKHPNIIKVLEAFAANNTVYYAMEYIDGGSLDDLIKQKHGLSEDETLRLTRQIASALSYMHQHKMLHLDLKPGNIMIKNDNAVLIDFGLSKQYDDNGEPESSTTVGGGTPGYAPLEQSSYHEGHGFPVTMDVYALGGTMYKMQTGQRPPDASEILNNGFPENTLRSRGISERTIGIVRKAMAPIRKDRYQNVSEFLNALTQSSAKAEENTVLENITSNNTIIDKTPLKLNNVSDSTIHETKKTNADTRTGDLSKKSTWLIICTLLLVILIIGIINANRGCQGNKLYSAAIEDSTVVDALADTTTVATRRDSIEHGLLPSLPEPEAVDLGLSVKWASCNLGARKPEEYGNYYAWGETVEKDSYTPKNYKWSPYKVGKYIKYCTDSIQGYKGFTDGKKVLEPDDDAATVNIGKGWRIPTIEEINELRNNCKHKWTTINGIKGM